ncbi:MAG: hypothetical protein ACK4Q5_17745 [Saprospiraceae bacterium]
MKNYFFGLTALVLLGMAACKKSDSRTPDCSDPVTFSLGDTLTLCLGQQAKFSGNAEVPDFSVTDVPFDNRCPIDAMCITAGWVETQIKFTLAGQTTTDTLSTIDANVIHPDSTSVGTARFRLLDATPYPKLGQVIDKQDYKIKIVVW